MRRFASQRALQVRVHGQTDTGRKRTSNEDQFLIAMLSRAMRVLQTSVDQPEIMLGAPEGYLFIVADGVGGHAAGEKASEMAVSSIERFVVDTLKWCIHLRSTTAGDPILLEFQKALVQANDKVIYEADQHPEWHGMATTITLGYFFHREVFVAHVGDSRCYLLRNGLLYRLTRDHTFVAEMVRRASSTRKKRPTMLIAMWSQMWSGATTQASRWRCTRWRWTAATV